MHECVCQRELSVLISRTPFPNYFFLASGLAEILAQNRLFLHLPVQPAGPIEPAPSVSICLSVFFLHEARIKSDKARLLRENVGLKFGLIGAKMGPELEF